MPLQSKASQLVARIERAGGKLWVTPDGKVRARRLPKCFVIELKARMYQVAAILRDRQPGVVPAATAVGPICTCDEHRHPHKPHGAAPRPGVKVVSLEQARARLKAEGAVQQLKVLDYIANKLKGGAQ